MYCLVLQYWTGLCCPQYCSAQYCSAQYCSAQYCSAQYCRVCAAAGCEASARAEYTRFSLPSPPTNGGTLGLQVTPEPRPNN